LLESLEGKRGGQIRPKPPCPPSRPVRQADGGQQRHLAGDRSHRDGQKRGLLSRFGMAVRRHIDHSARGDIKYGGLVEKAFGLTLRERSSILAAAQPPAELSEPCRSADPSEPISGSAFDTPLDLRAFARTGDWSGTAASWYLTRL